MIDTGRVGRRSAFASVRAWCKTNERTLAIFGTLFLLTLAVFWGNIVVTIGTGEVGVMWSRVWGTRTDVIYRTGTHIILPWNVITIYDTRYQIADRTFVILSRDRLELTVEAILRFKPITLLVPKLHQQIGPDYLETVVVPEVRTAVQSVFGGVLIDQLASESAEHIQSDIVLRTRRALRSRFVLLDDVVINRIVVPPFSVAAAIQRTLEQERAALEIQLRLSRGRLEDDAKNTRAGSVPKNQETIVATLGQQLLQLKRIEAKLELARSNSSSVGAFGDNDRLPVIMMSMAPAGAAPLPPVPPAPEATPPRR